MRGGQPLPLYPNPESPRPPAEVARLFGPIAAIDGEDVSRRGKSFALLPGCHIVRLVDKVGAINTSSSGGYVGTIGGVIFALRMKASFAYEIEVGFFDTTGPTGQLTIRAWERAADGSSATPIAPARSERRHRRLPEVAAVARGARSRQLSRPADGQNGASVHPAQFGLRAKQTRRPCQIS